VFAVVTSIVSIWLARGALRVQREHDRKSVLPLPQIVIGDTEFTCERTLEWFGRLVEPRGDLIRALAQEEAE
jgi:hypothetical protein